MRRSFVVSLAALSFLAGCNNTKKPNNANFTKAINQYLAKRGEACSSLGQTLPVDVTVPEQKDQYGIGPQLAALEEADLVHSTNTTAVVHGMLDALRGSTPPQPVRRYELTDQGKQYYRQIPSTFGQNGIFCYGRKTVDSIVKWTEPATMEGTSQSEVTYTYKIADLAPWAKRPDVQREFGDIRTTVNGISKANEIAGLQLANKGWEVPEP
jgi:hypothetical protein